MQQAADASTARRLLQPANGAELREKAAAAFRHADRNGNKKLEWAKSPPPGPPGTAVVITHNEVMEFVEAFFGQCGMAMPRCPESHWYKLKEVMDTNRNLDLEFDEAERYARKCLELAFPDILLDAPDNESVEPAPSAGSLSTTAAPAFTFAPAADGAVAEDEPPAPPPLNTLQATVGNSLPSTQDAGLPSALPTTQGAEVAPAKWDIEDSFELCDEGEESAYEGIVFLSDAGIQPAVDGFNSGDIQRPAGDCVAVLSQSLGKYFVLHAPGKREEAMRMADEARWKIENTFEICSEENRKEFEGKIAFLTEHQAQGVQSAVQGLRAGSIEWPASGFCAVYSKSKGAYFCIYASGKRKAAFEALGLIDP